MSMPLRMEFLYHKIMLKKCKTKEEREWEKARHEIMNEVMIEEKGKGIER